jgi:SAM-dependent methyltransferase
MFNYLKLQKNKPIKIKILFLLSLARRTITLRLGSHQLDSPSHYCKGHGLEIGASDCPYPFANCKMDYADFFNDERADYLGKKGFISLSPPSCLLTSVIDGYYNFIYASHVLEHTPNPLRTLEEWVRVVRNGGIIYLVVPNKNKTYDTLRETTTLEWFEHRYQNNIWDFSIDEISLMVTKTKGLPHYDVPDQALSELCFNIMNNPDGTHHYTVYDPHSLIKFGDYASRLFNLEVVNLQVIRHEMHLVMRRR